LAAIGRETAKFLIAFLSNIFFGRTIKIRLTPKMEFEEARGKAMTRQILEGVKIIALETSVSGPFCSVLLADFGAEVIKIEIPGRGDIARHWDTVAKGLSGYFVYLNRNKKSLELDLKSDEGRKILMKLISQADVFVENYRPEAIERLGLTYDELRKVNSRLIYCGISGYGKDGPYKNEPAYDLLIQAEAGLISVTGYEDRPAKIGVSICDLVTGIYSAFAISLALFRREKTGEGCEIDMSMFECALSLLLAYPMYFWYRGQKPRRQGMKHSLIAPAGPYLTKDGKYVVISVDREEEWQRFCKDVLGDDDLATDPRFNTNEARLSNRKELETLLEEKFEEQTQEFWFSKLRSAKVANSRLNEMDDVVNHPQAAYRKFLSEVTTEKGKVKLFGNPVKISGFPPLLGAVPALGEHNDSIIQILKQSQT
jgi:itaconate CoA-transferase